MEASTGKIENVYELSDPTGDYVTVYVRVMDMYLHGDKLYVCGGFNKKQAILLVIDWKVNSNSKVYHDGNLSPEIVSDIFGSILPFDYGFLLGGLIDTIAGTKESVLLVLDTDLNCDYKINTVSSIGLDKLYTNNIADPIEYEANNYFIALTTAQFEDND